MPLDSGGLTRSTIEILCAIPLDKESCKDLYIPYQTKVSIYDNNCKNCGFVRVEAHSSKDDKLLTKIFKNIDEAIDHASKKTAILIRTCDYPSDVDIRGTEKIYPTLTEIVTNTCIFWNQDRMGSIEAETIEINAEDLDDYKKGLFRQ